MKRSNHSLLHLIIADAHHPEHSEEVISAALDFMGRNKEKMHGVSLLGDNMDSNNFSRHTKGKPRLRTKGGILKDLQTFDADILKPIEQVLPKGAVKNFFLGNHEDWMEQWLDENPEWEGLVEIGKMLDLRARGWDVVNQGDYRRVGKAYLIHGDQVGSGQNVAKKLVDSFCATVIMGHVHTASSFTKVSQIKAKDKWTGYTMPTAGTVSPKYAKGRPNAFVQGLGVIELWPKKDFVNVYTPIVLEGQFSLGGEMYGG